MLSPRITRFSFSIVNMYYVIIFTFSLAQGQCSFKTIASVLTMFIISYTLVRQ